MFHAYRASCSRSRDFVWSMDGYAHLDFELAQRSHSFRLCLYSFCSALSACMGLAWALGKMEVHLGDIFISSHLLISPVDHPKHLATPLHLLISFLLVFISAFRKWGVPWLSSHLNFTLCLAKNHHTYDLIIGLERCVTLWFNFCQQFSLNWSFLFLTNLEKQISRWLWLLNPSLLELIQFHLWLTIDWLLHFCWT